MKLSEAIREGAKLRPQGREVYFYDGKSCAIGAALEGAGVPYSEFAPNTYVMDDLFPLLKSGGSKYPCPLCSDERTLFRVIIHLNDFHKWTREQIAQWVESVESESL